MRPLTTAAVFVATTALAFGACGDDDDEGNGGGQPAGGGGGGSAQTLEISADPGGALKFDTTTLTAKPGTVTINMANPSDVPHAVEIEGNGVEEKGETVQKDGTSTATAELKAGEYEFYCPVGNHEAAGMKGTLTVE